MKLLVYLIFASAVVYASQQDYKGWKTFYVRPSSHKQVQEVHSIVERFVEDFLVLPTIKNEGIALVKPKHLAQFTKTMNDLHISYAKHCNNINIAFENDKRKIGNKKEKIYQKLKDINKYLIKIAKHYPDRVTLVKPGESFQKRPIYYLKISNSKFDGSKPIIIIDGGMHASDWISPPTVTRAIHKLVENVTEPDLLDNFDWILFPVVNPDGYKYAFSHDRFWRKNRSTAASSECPGVDINRNFGYNWKATPSHSCKANYPGVKAYSEIETRILSEILIRHREKTLMYISMHGYGTFIVYPSMSKMSGSLQAIGGAMSNAINLVTQNLNYSVGSSFDLIGHKESTGTSLDYAHAVGIPLSFVFELPGFSRNVNSFVADVNLINTVVQDTWRAIVASARTLQMKKMFSFLYRKSSKAL